MASDISLSVVAWIATDASAGVHGCTFTELRAAVATWFTTSISCPPATSTPKWSATQGGVR